MSATRLRQLLSESGLAPDNVRDIVPLCNDWFRAEPNLTTFTLRAIFLELSERWSDTQAVPTASILPFQARLLPLQRVVDQIGEPAAELPAPALNELVQTFHQCCRDATPPQ